MTLDYFDKVTALVASPMRREAPVARETTCLCRGLGVVTIERVLVGEDGDSVDVVAEGREVDCWRCNGRGTDPNGPSRWDEAV